MSGDASCATDIHPKLSEVGELVKCTFERAPHIVGQLIARSHLRNSLGMDFGRRNSYRTVISGDLGGLWKNQFLAPQHTSYISENKQISSVTARDRW